METKQRLDAAIESWYLLKHPFYQAWECGELPVDGLKVYAEEYGALISLMPSGWTTLNDAHTTEEEEEHIELWADFADGLNTTVAEAQISEVKALVETTRELFSQPTTALGALYAFETQQPETAKSKLEGLRKFYNLDAKVEPYFEEHSHNEHEAEKLLARIEELPEDEREVAFAACETMSKSLWDALTGIFATQKLN